MSKYWVTVLFGVACVLTSVLAPSDGGTIKGFPVSPIANWVKLIVGFLLLIVGVYGVIKGRAKTRPYTEEEVERSKRELREMYIRKHGHPPPDLEAKDGE